MTREDLLTEALKLSLGERADLAGELLKSLEEPRGRAQGVVARRRGVAASGDARRQGEGDSGRRGLLA